MRNCIERAVILNKGERILLEHLLLFDIAPPQQFFRFPIGRFIPLKELERRYIDWLEEKGGYSRKVIAAKPGPLSVLFGIR